MIKVLTHQKTVRTASKLIVKTTEGVTCRIITRGGWFHEIWIESQDEDIHRMQV